MVNIEIKNNIEIQEQEYPESWIHTKIFLDNQEASKYEGESHIEEIRGISGHFVYKTVVINAEHNKKIYILSLHSDVNQKEKFRIFDEIISTFKFTDQE